MIKRIVNIFFALLAFYGVNIYATPTEKPIAIIIPSFNNEDWYEKNLNSVLQQNYDNYRIIYINDCSSDRTGQVVEETVKKCTDDYQITFFDCPFNEDIPTSTQIFGELINKKNCFFTLINNRHRHYGALPNLYRAIHSCNNDEIVVLLDGDDWLFDNDVLQKINTFYASENIWLTHGRFIEYPNNNSSWSQDFSNEVIRQNAFRQNRIPTHLKTFYSCLFKKIRLEDLLYNGIFCPMTGDMAMMFPMIEMAGERHAYSHEINYVYNVANPINDNKINPQLQRDMDAYIRTLPPYHRIESLQ